MVPYPPIEPTPVAVRFPEPRRGEDVIAVSRSLSPALVLEAYKSGIFPWPVRQGLVPWASPDPRAIFPLERPKPWPRTVRRALKGDFRISIDEAFEEVMKACSERRGEGTWITPDIVSTYAELHRLGWAHSVEVFDRSGRLAGGLYGVRVAGLFAGESMFYTQRDASKVALMALVGMMRESGMSLLDVQWHTAHLASLGAIEVTREEYLRRLALALAD